MKKSASQPSNSFRRTRNDHATETAEDYVEAIAEIQQQQEKCRAADLARLFGVSHVTVAKTLARLESEGLVQTQPYAPVELTPRGRRLAAASQQRHQTVVDFLVAIGVDPQTAEIDAEGIEHHVSKVTLDCFQRVIDQRQA
jgi:DtxR family manganese transport transcriptional regulator